MMGARELRGTMSADKPSSAAHIPARVALILDCDGTIAVDTTSQLLDWIGIDSGRFWKEVEAREADGWEGTIYWTSTLLSRAASLGRPVTRELLDEFAKDHLEFAPGVPAAFPKLAEFVRRRAAELRVSAELDVHIITSGLEDMLEASVLAPQVNEIWGSTLAYDGSGLATGPKSLLSFTEKTKCLFAVNKGVQKAELRRRPSMVNLYRPMAARPIPFDRMIYIGDGDTDVPCFSIIIHAGGQTVGVRSSRPRDSRDLRPRWGPYGRDYTEGSDLYFSITDQLNDMLSRLAGP